MIDGVCTKCVDTQCKTCSGLDTGLCTDCKNKLFIKDGKCVDSCGDGYYVDEKNICKPCLDDCKVCPNSIKCTQCTGDYMVLEGSDCVIKCPPGFIPSGGTCVPCTGVCGSCLPNSLETCTGCTEGYVLLEKNPYLFVHQDITWIVMISV